MNLAFKNGQRAAEIESGAARFFSREIMRVTGGDWSHVECWLSGPREKALCSASREPGGISFQTLDLTDKSLWSIIGIPTTPEQDLAIEWFCKGSDGKRYDAEGIVGIGTGTAVHDSAQRFCSEYAAEIGTAVLDIPCLRGILRWMVAPSGPEHKFGNGQIRYGLRDLLVAAGYGEI